jgi:hypothetical protein
MDGPAFEKIRLGKHVYTRLLQSRLEMLGRNRHNFFSYLHMLVVY